jgi:hypothetical protein
MPTIVHAEARDLVQAKEVLAIQVAVVTVVAATDLVKEVLAIQVAVERVVAATVQVQGTAQGTAQGLVPVVVTVVVQARAVAATV